MSWAIFQGTTHAITYFNRENSGQMTICFACFVIWDPEAPLLWRHFLEARYTPRQSPLTLLPCSSQGRRTCGLTLQSANHFCMGSPIHAESPPPKKLRRRRSEENFEGLFRTAIIFSSGMKPCASFTVGWIELYLRAIISVNSRPPDRHCSTLPVF